MWDTITNFFDWFYRQVTDWKKVILYAIFPLFALIAYVSEYFSGVIVGKIEGMLATGEFAPGLGSVNMAGINGVSGGFASWCMSVIPLEVIIQCLLFIVLFSVQLALVRLAINVYKLIPLKAT